MDTQTWIILLVLIIGIFAVYVWRQRREISDGKAMWWATVAEPIAYVSDDPFDETVTQRAENAKALLEAHGNGYLKPETDVWVYVYAATPQHPTRDFSLWQDLVLLEIIKRREAWRKQKLEWNGDAGKQHFAGQAVFTKTNQN
jgi:hypothetical protein